MFGIGPMELVLILVIALLVLGPKRMPELARTLGRGLSEFRRASNDLRQSLALDDLQNELRDGLTGEGKIAKPGQKAGDDQDRPAQAGADLPPGEEGKENTDASGEGRTHPGELPLDADPHEHHDSQDEEADPKDSAAPASPAKADSELGNVPVGGGPPANSGEPKRPPGDDERG